MSNPYVIIGLGNPGIPYALTRHNIGMLLLERISDFYGIKIVKEQKKSIKGYGKIGGSPIILVKPLTFMNVSGEVIEELKLNREIDNGRLIVLHDDADLEFGRIKIKGWGGHAGHKGLISIMNALGTDKFIRIRMGIGRSKEGRGITDYVLSPFSSEEMAAMGEFLSMGLKAVESIIMYGLSKSMSIFNRKSWDQF